MYYRIDEIKIDARATRNATRTRLLVFVSFWTSQALHDAGELPRWREDFLMDVTPTITRIVENRSGHFKRKRDGVFVDPATLTPGDATEWETETIANDVPALIRANIERHLQREPNKRGAHFDAAAKPTASDTTGILQRSDVQNLKGRGQLSPLRDVQADVGGRR